MGLVMILFTAVSLLIIGCQSGTASSKQPLTLAAGTAPTLESLDDSVHIDYVPAAELPQRPADIMGGFLSQDGERIMVGSGFVDISPDGQGGYQTKHEGPLVALKTNDRTRFWADVTQTSAGQASGGNIVVQQEVEAVRPPVDLPYPAFISVWGQWQDETLLVEDILFDVPGD